MQKNICGRCDFPGLPAFNIGMNEVKHPFLAIVEQHSAAIGKICRSFCRSCPEEMEDLRQDIILALWTGWKRYRPTARSITWVWRIALNTSISWWRNRQRQVPSEPLPPYEIAASDDSQEAALINHLASCLTPPERRLLDLYLEGWSMKEIGVMLGMSETNVQTKISRIKKKMRNYHETDR